MLYAAPGSSVEVASEGAATGLVGTIGVRIMDGVGGTTQARTTAGIVETPAGSGVYVATLTAPTVKGSYLVVWDDGSSNYASEQLWVTYDQPTASIPGGPDAPYFTVAEFRTRYTDLTVAAYPDATVEEYRQLAEQAIEDACGVAFVPRTKTTTVNYNSRVGALDLGPQLRSVTAVGVDGTDWIAGELADLDVDSTGIVYLSGGWRGLVTVSYEYGYDEPPLRVKQAVMALTRQWMVHGPVTDRATQLPTEFGGTINLATPGSFGATFGLPEVDATLAAYRLPVVA